jgi:2-polyprenyl-6-methoxyphenol hydroxylase-like FAD-dependent oxidoreductase
MVQRAVVVGAGIGGLVTALALAERGWDVRVVERAASLEPVGAGIVLAPNAMRALNALGVGEAVRERGHVPVSAGLRESSGRWIQHLPSSRGSDGVPIVTIHRADLVEVLRAHLPSTALTLECEVLGLHQSGDVVGVTTSAGELEAELVVGADGIRSLVRSALFPAHPEPQYGGYMAWRAIVDTSRLARAIEPVESWGRGRLFGIVPLAGDRAYLYATAKTPLARVDTSLTGSADGLRAAFAGWHDPIPELLAGVRDEHVLAHPIYWLGRSLDRFHLGRVALVGDAAHAMTPNLGQGACQAIEDAVTLAATVDPADLARSLDRYSSARVPRATAVARLSYRIGRISHASNPVTATLRNAAARAMGRMAPRLVARGTDSVMEWRPPTRLDQSRQRT